MGRESADPNTRRTRLRDKLWPNADEYVWTVTEKTKGYLRLTRLLPLVLRLVNDLAGKTGDPSSVYLELLFRDFGQGMVEIDDQSECAFAAGYDGSRGLRTWKLHLRTLSELRFVRVQPKGNNEFGFVLLVHPLAVVAWHRNMGNVPDNWWNMFESRAAEIGAEIPDETLIERAFAPRLVVAN